MRRALFARDQVSRRSSAGLVQCQRMAVRVADDVAVLPELGVRVIDGLRRQEAGGEAHQRR
jgi:hypothetical protein